MDISKGKTASERTHRMSARSKASLRQLDECAGAVRQPASSWGQAMLFFTRQLAERSVQAIRQKHWIVSETLLAARRPYETSGHISRKLFEMTIRPSDT